MTAKNIIIVGITGVGKTTIGKVLSEKLDKQFIDLDKYIEVSCGVDIPTIFELEGEQGFRDRESLALKQVISQNDNYVLSLGGGCVIRAENRQIITRSNNLVLQLIADLKVIVERLVKSPNKRPLLANQDIQQKIENLFNERKEFYDAVSDLTVNTTNLKPAQVVSKVEQYL
ncbi:shikimate kinase [Aquella oligotrophica]|uniref:Shikimate kinase n=1 Tax=Aquella oligotrophica TaxID=2067065 RepID=A0A2I7N349_9NEIS|nr:shikimate kinase [Aquella oligotrophica]AUR50872.1 shikimate kinase [Aquella oligotrophica]